MFVPILLSLFFITNAYQIDLNNLTVSSNLENTSAKFIATENQTIGPIRIKENNNLGIKTTAKSILVIDQKTKKVLFQKNALQKLPIASLSKLVWAMVFLDHQPNWEKIVTIEKTDQTDGANLAVKPGEQITVKDLFYAALIGSNNNAIKALIRSVDLTEDEFISAMNEKVSIFGLENTFFKDSTGLAPENVSNAFDLVLILEQALAYPQIKEAVLMPKYTLITQDSGRIIKVKTTNKLLNSFLNQKKSDYHIVGGKTGYLDEAGNCLAIEAVNQKGDQIIAVILGTKKSEDRFQEMKGLIVWTFQNYIWE